MSIPFQIVYRLYPKGTRLTGDFNSTRTVSNLHSRLIMNSDLSRYSTLS